MAILFGNLTIVSWMFFMFLIANWILFTIRSIIFFFLCIILDYKNLKFKHLIDNIAIHFFYLFGNFANMKDMKKNIYNPTMNLSKFTSNKKILSEIAVLEYK